LNWLKTKSNTLISIDISSRYIKLIELVRHPKSPYVNQFAITELPMMVLTENNEIKDSATISTVLLELQQKLNLKSKQVIISMPGSAVATKQITLKNDAPQDMENQAWLEAGQYFQELLEDLSLDFHIQEIDEEKNEADVLLVACRKSSIQKKVEVLHDSQFQTEIVDVDYYALERLLNHLLQNQPDANPEHISALLNFSSNSSTLIVLQNGKLIYAYEQVFDSQKLLQTLKFNLKWQSILSMENPVYTELDETAKNLINDTLIHHINHSLELFYSSNQFAGINQLFLAGDCAIIPKLDELVAAHVGIPSKIADPFAHLAINPSLNKEVLSANAPALALCMGLALHEGTT